MNINSETVIVLTGASGGLGHHITKELIQYRPKLALVAFPGIELEALRLDLQKSNIEAFSLTADLSKKEERERTVQEVKKTFGKIDILINNAGIEFTAPYHDLSEEQIQSVIDINLVAPMQLSRLVIPDMLENGAGHIVNMSSLAGKASPAYQEAYAATKAGLIGFTTSLRETYFDDDISASVICPGFVEAGIYTRLKESSGHSAPPLLGTTSPEKVAKAVVRSIHKDVPQIIVNPLPVKPLLAITEISPKAGQWIVRAIGAHKFFKDVHKSQKQQ